MTARSKNTRNEFIDLLKEKNIYYDELIMGVNPGTRYVINDIKPSHFFTKQAVAINIIRDSGINDLVCDEYKNNNIKIKKIFKGGSFSNTYLLEKNGKYIVRKHIIKNEQTMEHYYRLKRQCDDMKRFHYYDNKIVPAILDENDNNFDYFYDMDFLQNYEQLDNFHIDVQRKAIVEIMTKINSNIYCYKKILNYEEQCNFMDNYLQDKIYCKLEKFEKECNIMNYLINKPEIFINGIKYFGLKEILNKINIYDYKPNFICPIHGDLNFENILYNTITHDVMTIDMDGSRYVDTPFFDLGKLFQSLVSNYEIWSKIDNVILSDDINNLICIEGYFEYNIEKIDFLIKIFKDILQSNNEDLIIKSGIFYMANYFIRFIPFRLKISKKHGLFAMIMAIVWLNKII
jgi:hypothetical protein